jgi:uncharacterized membrane protein
VVTWKHTAGRGLSQPASSHSEATKRTIALADARRGPSEPPTSYAGRAMKRLVDNFLKGCLVSVPTVTTVYVVWFVLTRVDALVPAPIPGLGIVVSVVAITAIGAVASNVVGRRLVDSIERLLRNLPVVRLLFASIKDLMSAFVGERRTFDKPVLIRLDGSGGLRALGFVTCESFDDPRLSGHVAVYVPQSYNFAGNVVVVPRDRVEPIDADGAEFMAFIVSGGVSGMSAARTYLDTMPLPGRRSTPGGGPSGGASGGAAAASGGAASTGVLPLVKRK